MEYYEDSMDLYEDEDDYYFYISPPREPDQYVPEYFIYPEPRDPLSDQSFFLTDSHLVISENKIETIVENKGQCKLCFPASSRAQAYSRQVPINLPQIEPFSHFIYYATLHTNDSLIGLLISAYENEHKTELNSSGNQKLTFKDSDWKSFSIKDVYGIKNKALEAVHNSPMPYNIGYLKEGECLICCKRRVTNCRICCDSLICNECMANYISVEIEQSRLSHSIKIECPSCPRALEMCEILLRLKYSLFKNSFTTLSRRLIELSCNEREYKCPSSTCGNIIKIDKPYTKHTHLYNWFSGSSCIARNPKVKCNVCGIGTCSNCKSVSHDGITCKKFQDGDHTFYQWAQNGQKNSRDRKATKCPTCQQWYHKTDGCDHMTCPQCKTNFCYLCGGSMEHGKENIFGDHDSKYRINGCTENLFLDRPIVRRTIRGSILTGTIILAPILLLWYILRMILFKFVSRD